jgi:cell division protein FtsB
MAKNNPRESFSLDRANQIVIRCAMIRFMTSRVSSRTVGHAPLRLRQLVPAGVMALMMVGLVTQALQGERGLRGWMDLQAEKQTRAKQLAALKAQNAELQNHVFRLSDETLDLDFLDERARLVLGLTGKNEQVIISN